MNKESVIFVDADGQHIVKDIINISSLNDNNSLSLPTKYSIMEDVNRLKIVLVEKKKTSKWLAEQLDVNPSTVSKWCTNTSQPPLDTLIQISQLLKVEVTELIRVPQK